LSQQTTLRSPNTHQGKHENRGFQRRRKEKCRAMWVTLLYLH